MQSLGFMRTALGKWPINVSRFSKKFLSQKTLRTTNYFYLIITDLSNSHEKIALILLKNCH